MCNIKGNVPKFQLAFISDGTSPTIGRTFGRSACTSLHHRDPVKSPSPSPETSSTSRWYMILRGFRKSSNTQRAASLSDNRGEKFQCGHSLWLIGIAGDCQSGEHYFGTILWRGIIASCFLGWYSRSFGMILWRVESLCLVSWDGTLEVLE